MNRPNGSPTTAEGPFTSGEEEPRPACADPDTAAADGENTPGGAVPDPTTDAEHDSGTARDGDRYRPL
ncbi:hypothetical protein [Streptomyces sp. NBC_00448]|uniref:hypothetical protein n=1 Tax=Streptomyces sp. NBC_00448 TaxID=2903652 RepID=UPI002E210D3C